MAKLSYAPADLPDNEAWRLQSLRDLNVLDTAPEAEFDALVKVASMVCGVPISLISLVDAPLCQTSCRRLFSMRMIRRSDKNETYTPYPRIQRTGVAQAA